MSKLKLVNVPKPPNVFVNADLAFKVGDRTFEYKAQQVSLFGVTDLDLKDLDPERVSGMMTNVAVEVDEPKKFKFITSAVIVTETSPEGARVGLRFHLLATHRTQLAKLVREHGYVPKDYSRKFPRIPAAGVLSDMPLHVIIFTMDNEMMVCEIGNLSPGGILVWTENPKASLIIPDERIRAQVEPRGRFFEPFSFEGKVCRVMQEQDPKTKNIRRHLGIQFTKISEHDQANFKQVLVAVLSELNKSDLVDK